jgi:hypothetical protein
MNTLVVDVKIPANPTFNGCFGLTTALRVVKNTMMLD